MDLIRVLSKLRPGDEFLLNRSNPPHTVLAWRGKTKMPTVEEMEACWETLQQEDYNAPPELSVIDRLLRLESEVFSGRGPAGKVVSAP